MPGFSIAGCLLLVALAILALPPLPAMAKGTKDYTWIINSLKEEGISPSRIQWAQIETQCQPLNASREAYQQCRLDKARLQADYQDDADSCTNTSRAFVPNTLRYQAVVIDHQPPAGHTNVLTLLNNTPAVADAAAFRRHLFNECMRSYGWRSPSDYRRGRLDL